MTAVRKRGGSPSASSLPDPVTTPVTDPAPEPVGGPLPEWNSGLYQRVITAIYALPSFFRSSLNIAGIRATDLYTLNTALGAAIEQSVVDNLNGLRSIWDPEGVFSAYSFVRQPQAFPDVRLQASAPNMDSTILLGIELKGWFALSKEGEPSFRYQINPNACADADLLVVFPWILDEIVSGKPRLLRPFVTEARFAAEQRNYYWRVLRRATGEDAEIIEATHRTPYPSKADRSNDSARRDAGNFGRVARTNLMTEYISALMLTPVAGIPLGAWQRFIKIFSDGIPESVIQNRLGVIAATYSEAGETENDASMAFGEFADAFETLVQSLSNKPA